MAKHAPAPQRTPLHSSTRWAFTAADWEAGYKRGPDCKYIFVARHQSTSGFTQRMERKRAVQSVSADTALWHKAALSTSWKPLGVVFVNNVAGYKRQGNMIGMLGQGTAMLLCQTHPFERRFAPTSKLCWAAPGRTTWTPHMLSTAVDTPHFWKLGVGGGKCHPSIHQFV